MSLAGHAATADARELSFKDSLASADLTQVSLTQPQVDAVVNCAAAIRLLDARI